MAFCGKCGTQVNEGVKFCPSCGSPMGTTGQEQKENQQTSQGKQSDFSTKLSELNNTKDSTADFDKADIEQNKGMAILAYISWLVLIPLFAAPKSRYARYHTNQGIILALAETVWWIVETILSKILYAISWRLGFLSSILALVNLVFLVFLIIGIRNVSNGKAKELPIIGKFKLLK